MQQADRFRTATWMYSCNAVQWHNFRVACKRSMTVLWRRLCSLVNELRGWVTGHEEELRRQQQQQQQLDQQAKQAAAKPRKKYYLPRKLKAAMRGAVGQPSDLDSVQ